MSAADETHSLSHPQPQPPKPSDSNTQPKDSDSHSPDYAPYPKIDPNDVTPPPQENWTSASISQIPTQHSVNTPPTAEAGAPISGVKTSIYVVLNMILLRLMQLLYCILQFGILNGYNFLPHHEV
ncbi:hypothetical protein L6164_016025 [Bauhinia variegata]|uniref:Uncharacterized protein n=1 Tax=Bauhinia variegata TaxID=167791 RepID=A0ACB9NPG1_BAUVA|nr:hypothetical protein L6164_016025 [Bauhinia variegata]